MYGLTLIVIEETLNDNSGFILGEIKGRYHSGQ
ncbi:hypothetical protein Xekk_03400 [Xenorhabdus sp. KK7.4]|nr:hypothetical protein Xekk_03400 [Xenorhabdus sp. KK7.4]